MACTDAAKGKNLQATDADEPASYSEIPETLSSEWVTTFSASLEKATWRGQKALKALLPVHLITQLLSKAAAKLTKEPTLVDVDPQDANASVTVVGDTHGQMHDVLHMLRTAGEPSATRHYVFNGDFVDRGAWGLEVLLVLAAWKLAFPTTVFLLRGNHETATCTTMYGFKGELDQKFGKAEAKSVYAVCKRLFSALPLAARVGRATLVVHGGLFRKPPPAPTGKNKRKRTRPAALNAPCELGSLADLAAAGKGGVDPNGRGSTLIATDALWSDPVRDAGIELNHSRGVGTVFGPDVTQRFLESNQLRLVLRSHEGPDARHEREDMPSMQGGWSTDHEVPAGRLLTVFSAPDYPQFQAEEERFANLGAVAVLRGPEWCHPEMLQYSAVLPRPPATAAYDYADMPGSDEEIEIAGSDISKASSITDLEDTAAMPDAAPVGSPPPLEADAQEPEVDGLEEDAAFQPSAADELTTAAEPIAKLEDQVAREQPGEGAHQNGDPAPEAMEVDQAEPTPEQEAGQQPTAPETPPPEDGATPLSSAGPPEALPEDRESNGHAPAQPSSGPRVPAEGEAQNGESIAGEGGEAHPEVMPQEKEATAVPKTTARKDSKQSLLKAAKPLAANAARPKPLHKAPWR